MIILRSSQTANDAPLAAVTYTTNLGIPPVIRLVAEPLIEAESLSLDTFGLKETTRHNCGFTPKRAAGFPAWPILTDPGNAHHALNLVKDVEWARRKAKTEAGKVKKRIDELVTTLQSSAPHFLPTFLEEIARIFADAGNLSYAKQYFGKARDVERAHDLAIDQARHAQAFVEFARMGLVTAKVFSQEARDASKRLEPEEAYRYFFNLVITQAESGAETYSKILTDLKFLGKAAGLSERQIQEEFTAAYVPTRSFATSPDAVLAVVLRTIPEIVATHPELQEALYSIIPAQWHDVTNYVDNLHKLGLWEPLASNPERFRQWIADITAHGNKKWRFFDATNLELLRAIDRNHATLSGLHISTHSNKYHPDYLDALIAAGVEWSTIPTWDEAEAQFMMSAWISKHHRDLAHLVAQEEYRSWFLRGLADLNISRHATALLSGEPIRTVIRWKLEEIRDGQTKARGSHPEWLRLNWHASRVSSSRLRAYFPELIAQLLSVDPAAELAERLRRGTLVEYTWPEFEENAADFINQDTSISAVFPFVTAVNGKKVRIFSGASVRDCEIPVENVDTLVPTDDDVFVAYTNYTANGWYRWWLWLSDPQPHLITAPPSYSYENTGGEYATTVDGILHIGPAPITAGELDSDPKGVQLGFGPVYAANNAHAQSFTVLPTMAKITTAALNKQFAAGTLPGLEFPEAAALAAEHGAQLSFGDSFSAPAVTSTVDSPFGLDDGRHFALVLETESSGAYVVSPLGTFHSADESFLAIK